MKEPYDWDAYAETFFPFAEKLAQTAEEAEKGGEKEKASEYYLYDPTKRTSDANISSDAILGVLLRSTASPASQHLDQRSRERHGSSARLSASRVLGYSYR